MANSPSQVWENGVLVERAIATDASCDPNESEGTTSKPYKTPVPTSRSVEEREAGTKMVAAAENKSVKAATKK